jgi:hypothetical protein
MSTARKALLVCGPASSLLYVVMNIVGAMRFEGYNSISQAVSELSAIGAPSRPLWLALGIAYDVLVIAFGWGVWTTAGRNRALRIVGGLLVAFGAAGFAAPFVSMHSRGEEFTSTDTMHIAVTMVSVLIMLLTIGFGAASFGMRFRFYSIGTLVMHVVFGIWAGLDGPRLAANLPTPWLGLTERINIGLFLLWVVVLAVVLLRAEAATVHRENS